MLGNGEERCFSQQIDDAKALAHPDEPGHTKIAAAYEKELKDFFEQTLGVVITNDAVGDRAINIHCQGLQNAANLNQLSVEVNLDGIFADDPNGKEQIRPLSRGQDYTIVFDGVGKALVTLHDRVFDDYVPDPYTRSRPTFVQVRASFTATDGKRRSDRQSFPYDDNSL